MKTFRRQILGSAWALAFGLSAVGAELPDWKEGVLVPEGGNSNPYRLEVESHRQAIHQGKLHAQIYPVEVTGLLPPYRPFELALDGRIENPLSRLIRELLKTIGGIGSVDEALAWVGLHPYPAESDSGVYSVPFPKGVRPDHRMGLGLIQTPDGIGATLSCAACHSSNLFGKTVLGLSNRFPRANESFVLAKRAAPMVPASWLGKFADATPSEIRMFERVQENIAFVGVKEPVALGLDTSLAQVALSIARRGTDEYAVRDPRTARHPRPDLLDKHVADSKPAVWWNLKYKNRWLSDGSVVSGNPIYTNLLWNEIGRGVDLRELESWLERNTEVVRDLTSAVFSTEAPRMTDFFAAERFDLARAMKGQTLFSLRCARCHGVYEKAWDLAGAENLPLVKRLETTQVRYLAKTPVIDVGTDPGRFQGMVSLERALNPLAISKSNGIVIKAQKGYVPPPLVGIWARWPYFHNNSAPTLCAVLSPSQKRPRKYKAVEALNPARDFDSECNGYPADPKGVVRMVYDTSREGMRNTGHDEGILVKDGKELLSAQDKRDLILFLQTL